MATVKTINKLEKLTSAYGSSELKTLILEHLPACHRNLVTSEVNVLLRKGVQYFIKECLEEAVGAVFAGIQRAKVTTDWVGSLIALGQVLWVTETPGVGVSYISNIQISDQK